MRVYRIGLARHLATRKSAFIGKGGVMAQGRWHTEGHPIVYTSQSLSLAALEILVHLKATENVEPFVSYSADIPDDLILKPPSLPRSWKSRIDRSRASGDGWLAARSTPAMRVPTILAPGEWNVVVNPLHPDFSLHWVERGPEKFTFDARLLTPRQPGFRDGRRSRSRREGER